MMSGTWGGAFVFMNKKIGCYFGMLNGVLMIIFYGNSWVPYVNEPLESKTFGHVAGQFVLSILLLIRMTLAEPSIKKSQNQENS